ncbi:MAG TPA: hypothetical protein VI461_15055 [Chitinophagaceae bacterium]|nr:hypothetical protein [Chitinophagaceae bacterium]
MLLLILDFFSANDIFLVPLCMIIMYAVIRNRANNCKDESIKPYYYNIFYFKLFCVFAYVIVTAYYFGGGDTFLYYQAVKDFRSALSYDFGYLSEIITSAKLDDSSPLAPFFLYDDIGGEIYNYMQVPGNFFVPRLAIFPSLIFFNSYICICLCFMMFAIGGALRLFKTFYYYYPSARREIALATLFLPSVGFWSAGLLKDTICFGSVGFILYGILNVFIRKRKIGSSLFWIALSGYLLYTIKTYIFLVLLLAVLVWIFAETNRLIKDRTLRQIFAFMTFTIGVTAGYFMVQYFTSQETLKQYQLDNLVSAAETQRYNYLVVDIQSEQKTSYYSINASNPVLLVLNSIVATFYRPFPWEIRSAAAVLSTIEAIAFIILTANLFYKRGIGRPFRLIFKDPRLLMCFIFAMVFAVGVGAATANFGTLSRYKIPCMPFYLIMILLLYRGAGLAYPKWMRRILGYKNT